MLSPPLLPASARGYCKEDLGGHRGGSALAMLRSTAARSPSSGQATNRRVEDGRVKKEEKICVVVCFFFKSQSYWLGKSLET